MTAIQKLMEQMPPHYGGIIFSPQNRYYFTGIKSTAGVVLVSREQSCFLTDFRYYELAKQQVQTMPVEKLEEMTEQINCIFKQWNIEAFSIENTSLSFAQAKRFEESLQVQFLSDSTFEQAIMQLRCIKSTHEIESIKQAQQLTDEAFLHILDFIHPGCTEEEIALELEFFMRRKKDIKSEENAFDFIVVSGCRTSLPHGGPTAKLVEKGDFITMDFGATVNGLRSDMTRTICLGIPSEKQRQVYQCTLDAQYAALDVIRSGISGAEADIAARNIIDKAGYRGCFGHALGHGVGLDIHEGPTLSAKSKQILQPGMVVTVEPGIYLEGEFGVRIEDMVVVEENGLQNLTHSQKKLITI